LAYPACILPKLFIHLPLCYKQHQFNPMGKQKVTLLFIVSFILHISGFAQPLPVYSFQKDDTVLRKKYFDQSVKKKELILASVKKENAKDYKKIYEEQFKEITELWKGSRPVTSLDAHAYLQLIVQKIIIANPELKGTDARIVFSRDWWPNAVSMGDGTIAINAGLVIFLNNEAELVFILCHELAHYYLEHTPKAIKKYVETINGEAFQSELKRLSKTEFGVNSQLEKLTQSFMFNSRRHNREKETEADRYAFIFMKNTGYNTNAIKTCLELLDKVDDSLLYKPVVLTEILNFADYPFKKKWIQAESSIFSSMSDDNSLADLKERDSLKTHPDCTKRISLLQDSLAKTVTEGKEFLVDEKIFAQLKKEFFIEMTDQCYNSENLSRNLYYSLILLQSEPDNARAAYSVVRCFNQLYDKQKNHRLGMAVDTENKGYTEDYNLLLRMLSRLKLDEIAGLNYNFCRQHYRLMKDDKIFTEEMNTAKKLYKQ
jgi:Zn-dependent protease with chaperone function